MKNAKKYTFIVLCVIILILFFYSLGQPALSATGNIVVDYDSLKLIVLDSNVELARYTACLPAKPLKLPIRGKLIDIMIKPPWFPGPIAKKIVLKNKGIELPDKVPYGSPLNAMGEIKFSFDFAKGSDISYASRIHTTKQISSLGDYKSINCVRLSDQDGLDLKNYVEPLKTSYMIYADVSPGNELLIPYYGYLSYGLDLRQNSIGPVSDILYWQPNTYLGFIYETTTVISGISFEFHSPVGISWSDDPFNLAMGEIRDVAFIIEADDPAGIYMIKMFSGDRQIYIKTWEIIK